MFKKLHRSLLEIWWVYSILYRFIGKTFFPLLFFGIGRYLFYPLMLSLTGQLIDSGSEFLSKPQYWLGVPKPVQFLVALGVLRLLQITFINLYKYVYLDISNTKLYYDGVKEFFVKHIYRFNIAELEDNALVNRIKMFSQFWLTHARQFIVSTINLGGAIISLLITAWLLARGWSNDLFFWIFLILVGVVFAALYDIFYRGFLRKLRVKLAFKQRFYDYLYSTLLDVTWFLERKVNSLHKPLINLFQRNGEEFREIYLKTYKYLDSAKVFAENVKIVTLELARTGYFVTALYRKVAVGTILSTYNLLENIYWKIEAIFNEVSLMKESLSYLTDLKWILNYKGFAENHKGDIVIPAKQPLFLEIRNLSYKAPGGPVLLKNVNFTVQPFEKVFIFGRDGVGKTFLVKLLTAFFPVPEGTYFINGVPVERIKRHNVKELFSVVTDSFAKYYLSLKDNVTLGSVGPFDRSKYITALKISELYDWAKSEGVLFSDELLGNYFSNKALSIGHWQRISIARAVYRDKPIFLFDMPFTYIDDAAKFRIMANLLDYVESKRKTFIYIGEEFDFIQKFDNAYEKTPDSLNKLDVKALVRQYKALG